MNKVILSGHVGREPEIKYMQSGDAIVKFSVATRKRVSDGNGGFKDGSEWHLCKVRDQKIVTNFSKYVTEGSAIELEGHLETSVWTPDDGIRRNRTEIIVHTWAFCPGSKKKTDKATPEKESEGEHNGAEPSAPAPLTKPNPSYTADDDEPQL